MNIKRKEKKKGKKKIINKTNVKDHATRSLRSLGQSTWTVVYVFDIYIKYCYDKSIDVIIINI